MVENTRLVTGGSAEDGVEARDQLFDVKRFGEIIVGSEVEAIEAFVEGAAGGDEDDGDAHAFSAELTEDAEAVATGQHDIEDDGVVVTGGREYEAVVAIIGVVDDKAASGETLGHEPGEFGVIFDQKNFHGSPSLCGRPTGSSGQK